MLERLAALRPGAPVLSPARRVTRYRHMREREVTMGDQPCSACGGTGLTDKTSYEFELDDTGNQVPVQRNYTSACTNCGGTGRIG
ncbi:DnaJ-class molecular chaperone [Streptacidiphilus sp. MAP12-16]|uniref:hypothetical protein n=1 Tax=Streptacidiphilus sp. MAP12-16 TaxID=3156300 RepID=UPI003516337A